jgi:hypothetical protein
MHTADSAYPIEDLSDFKALALLYPNANRLLKEIIYRWRACSIRLKKKPHNGKWAVFLRSEWMTFSELSRNQYDRALIVLKRDGLVRAEREKFNGNAPHSYLQPTRLALKYKGRPDDLKRIGETKAENKPETMAEIMPEKMGEKIHSLPFLPFHPDPSSSSQSKTGTSSIDDEKKGKAGKSIPTKSGKSLITKTGVKLKLISSLESKKETPPTSPNSAPVKSSAINCKSDNDDAIAAAAAKWKKIQAAKSAEIDAKHFPKVPCSDPSKVKHPSEVNPQKWPTLSFEVKGKLYLTYLDCVANVNKAYAGKFDTKHGSSSLLTKYPAKLWDDYDDQAEAEWCKAHIAKAKGA